MGLGNKTSESKGTPHCSLWLSTCTFTYRDHKAFKYVSTELVLQKQFVQLGHKSSQAVAVLLQLPWGWVRTFKPPQSAVRVGRRISRSWLSRSGAGREFGLGRFLGPVLIWSDFKSLLSVLLISWQPTRMKREEGGALLATSSSRPGREQ